MADGGLSLTLPDPLLDAIAERVADRLAAQLSAAPGTTTPYLSVDEAADYLRCPTSRIYELKASGRLKHYKDGRRLLFRIDDLDGVLERGGEAA